MSDLIRQQGQSIKFGAGAWVILNPIEQSIKAKIEKLGTPLKDWDISINYGIKTGCNEAFIISKDKKDELISRDPKSAEIIRPNFVMNSKGINFDTTRRNGFIEWDKIKDINIRRPRRTNLYVIKIEKPFDFVKTEKNVFDIVIELLAIVFDGSPVVVDYRFIDHEAMGVNLITEVRKRIKFYNNK
jgi:hypothetical protein